MIAEGKIIKKNVLANVAQASHNMERLHDKLLDRIQFDKFKVITYREEKKVPKYA